MGAHFFSGRVGPSVRPDRECRPPQLHLIATKRPGPVAFGYLLGGVLMLLAGLVEVFFGVDAEQRPLEEISAPLSAVDGGSQEEHGVESEAAPRSLPRRSGLAPVSRQWRGSAAWSPNPVVSRYPPGDPYPVSEVEALVAHLDQHSPHWSAELARATSARFWGPGRLRQALHSGVASGRIRRVGGDRYAAGRHPHTAHPPAGSYGSEAERAHLGR